MKPLTPDNHTRSSVKNLSRVFLLHYSCAILLHSHRAQWLVPPEGTQQRGIVLFIHGFPQTSDQFRHVLPLIAARGYRCLAPDYRGAGRSSKPGISSGAFDFRKSTMAGDLVALLDALGIREPVHVVGHDIGGMIAHALASRWPDRVRSLCWGECPLPGTETYRRDTTDPQRVKEQFHFVFHCAPDGLAEALVAGRERTYIEHFFIKLTRNLDAFPRDAIDEYVAAYSQPGSMTCAFATYRAFETDASENQAWVKEHGKSRVPTLGLNGKESRYWKTADAMILEVTEKDSKAGALAIEDSGHWLAEENPYGFAAAILSFIERI